MIFLEYLKISLWMTPILLLALLLLPKIWQRYTAKLSYFVWLVIAVRLIAPWSLTLPEERTPIQLEVPQERIVQWVPMELYQPLDEAKWKQIQEERVRAGLPEREIPIEEKSGIKTIDALALVWLAGAVISMLRTAVSTLQLKNLLRRWEKPPSEKTQEFYEKTAGEKRPPLAVSSVLETPMAVGVFHTKIYLPHEEYTEQELEMIFRHELIHWRRKDLWYKFLLLLARSIHWFHPLVWLMAKRANRDLEISCDGEAVKEKDMAYRKAYSLMILQEAERGLQKQAALTTCFTDGKRALQERLVEIMNGKQRKKGMALVAVTLVLALTCGCLVSYGGSDPVSAQTDVALVEGVRSMAETWAKALETRDGKPRYEMMSEACKAAFIEEQKGALGDDWNYVIGWSSPWVMSYEVEAKEGTAIITYTMEDSSPSQYVMKELLRFGEENGKLVVVDHFCSNIYWEDGKVHPVRSKSGVELDEGIWDFMYQSVIGYISQSKWSIYELERFDFDILNVDTQAMSDGTNQVTVDFRLHQTYRNPFRDPDDVGYIKRAKETGHPHYQILYDEYYQQQEANTALRFVCYVQQDAAVIHEDTCDPERFCLYVDDGDPHALTFEKEYSADDSYYDETPADGWFCTLRLSIDQTHVAAQRQIIIPDTTGRTNNGYFRYDIGLPKQFEIAENAVVIVGGAGEEPRTMKKAEWINWRKSVDRPIGYTLQFERNEAGEFIITGLREGWWKATEVTARTKQGNVPSGYPTDSREITTAFAMWHPDRQHTGLDFSTDNKNIPVRATADGIILEAGFDAKKGNYVKINHLNGYTTLYAHLSKLDVKVGDQVKKGHVLGLTGKTGTAVGIHCHYEIQLNGIYQDPANYL